MPRQAPHHNGSTRVVRAAARGTGPQEEHDADQHSQGSEPLPWPYVLFGEPDPQRERDHQAHRSQGLHDDQRAAVECRGLKDPPRSLRDHSGQPDRLVENLDQEPWIVLPRGGLQRPFLLQDGAEGEGHRGQSRQPVRHCRPLTAARRPPRAGHEIWPHRGRRSQTTVGSSTCPGGGVPVTAFQPRAVRRALIILAMARPMPAAAAHRQGVWPREPRLCRIERRHRCRVLADGPIGRPYELPGEQAAEHPGDGGDQLPHPLAPDHVGRPSMDTP